MLGALQIGDITRQRVEHIHEGLGLLESTTQDLPPALSGCVRSLGRSFLSHLLADTAEDFRRETAVIRATMADLAIDAADLLKLFAGATGRDMRDDSGFLIRLRGHLDGALELVESAENADRLAAGFGAATAETALDLGARIDDLRRLQSEVQHMAINTRLKCSHIGADGNGLAVIAQELRAQARELDLCANRALAVIGLLREGARALAVPDGDGTSDDISSALRQAIERIREAERLTSEDTEALARLGREATEGLQAASQSLMFHVEVGQRLEAARDALKPPPEALDTGDTVRTAVGRFTEALALRYTMQREREAHAAAAASLRLDIAPLAPGRPPTVDDLEDFLFWAAPYPIAQRGEAVFCRGDHVSEAVSPLVCRMIPPRRIRFGGTADREAPATFHKCEGAVRLGVCIASMRRLLAMTWPGDGAARCPA